MLLFKDDMLSNQCTVNDVAADMQKVSDNCVSHCHYFLRIELAQAMSDVEDGHKTLSFISYRNSGPVTSQQKWLAFLER